MLKTRTENGLQRIIMCRAKRVTRKTSALLGAGRITHCRGPWRSSSALGGQYHRGAVRRWLYRRRLSACVCVCACACVCVPTVSDPPPTLPSESSIDPRECGRRVPSNTAELFFFFVLLLILFFVFYVNFSSPTLSRPVLCCVCVYNVRVYMTYYFLPLCFFPPLIRGLYLPE